MFQQVPRIDPGVHLVLVVLIRCHRSAPQIVWGHCGLQIQMLHFKVDRIEALWRTLDNRMVAGVRPAIPEPIDSSRDGLPCAWDGILDAVYERIRLTQIGIEETRRLRLQG